MLSYLHFIKNFCIAAALFCFLQLHNVNATTEAFRAHPNRVFVETGSFYGGGIQEALRVGFEEVYSIELAPHLYARCVERFKNNPKVHLYLGDSSEVLGAILQGINEPVTFWLDGHYSEGETAKGESNTPLLKELEIIASHHIKTHTIMIDDVRCFGTADFDGIDKETVINKLLAVNPEYTFHYQDGHVKDDILIAEVAKDKK